MMSTKDISKEDENLARLAREIMCATCVGTGIVCHKCGLSQFDCGCGLGKFDSVTCAGCDGDGWIDLGKEVIIK